MKLIFKVLAALGAVAAVAGTQGCMAFLLDEANMPKSLLNK